MKLNLTKEIAKRVTDKDAKNVKIMIIGDTIKPNKKLINYYTKKRAKAEKLNLNND